MAVIKQTKEKKEHVENNDVLITHGEEALTFRKDDPRTQKYMDKLADERLENMKKDGEGDLWAGISLSNARTEGESYGNYRERLKTIKELEKVYKKLGREECHKQFPNGFAYAIYISRQEELEKRNKMINKK
tara:strand:+ start:191 stop:586 length:396 start_codon:yes stop_codon:yes gene_type:complete